MIAEFDDGVSFVLRGNSFGGTHSLKCLVGFDGID